MEAYRAIDALGLYLTGSASNHDPDVSLGGAASVCEVRSMGAIVANDCIPGLLIEQVFPANGVGAGSITVINSTTGRVQYTPPDGLAGDIEVLASGGRVLLTGADQTKAIRVYRVAGAKFEGTTSFDIVGNMNGVFAMKNVTDAQRQAGVTTYRAIILSAHGGFELTDLLIWAESESGAQASFELGTEATVGGEIQTIANETTAPSGVSFSAAVDEGSAISIASLSPSAGVGLWIKRILPASGVADIREDVTLNFFFKGA